MASTSPSRRLATNAIVGLLSLPHHPVFTNFTARHLLDASELILPPPLEVVMPMYGRPPQEVVIDWLGVRVPRELYCHISYYRQRIAHAMRVQLCDLLRWAAGNKNAFPLSLPLPVVAEEYFEVVDTLEAVVEYVRGPRGRSFTMLEIGAGFGYWTLTAHAALRQLLGPANLAYEYTLVEIDFAKQQSLRSTLSLNGLDKARARIVHAAMGDRDEAGGAVQNGNPGWYAVYSCDSVQAHVHRDGNACASKRFFSPKEARDMIGIRKQGGAVADVISLPTLLAPYALVDFVDMDAQGAEWLLFNATASPAALLARQALDAKVLRVHIGTHDEPDERGGGHLGMRRLSLKEAALVEGFEQRGWSPSFLMGVTGDQGCTRDAERGTARRSPWGPVCMADGALSFVNERLRRRLAKRQRRADGAERR